MTADNHATVDLLAGDIDGDGDVDLVAINAGQPSRSYLSRAAPEVEVVIDPALGGSSGDTWAAAVADINRDGSPDVLVGRRNQPNDLYRNNGSVSPFDGVLGSPLDTLSDDTRGVALGDLDHDGDLDAVIGNFGQPSRVHINDGSADPFAAGAPADITGDLHDTWDILLADLTGDGHLDAITINTGQVTRVYPGDGSANPFANTVGVSLGSDAHASRAAAVGDMDGDGDLDLVVANFGQPNRLYLLDHTAADPIAEAVGVNISGDAHNTMAIALADLNGDGSLDVIAGNGGHQDRVYFNNGSPEPFANAAGLDLTADVLPTRALAVGDIDGDGKLDVVVGHQSGAARLVLAPADGLPAAAVDVPGVTGSVKALVLALIDFDGDLDLFVGRSQQVDLVILNGPLLGTPPPEGCAGYCAPTPLTCDDGNSCTVDACDTVLGCNASDIVFDCCGNGLPEQGEGCDDGNQEDGDGCSSSCLQEPN